MDSECKQTFAKLAPSTVGKDPFIPYEAWHKNFQTNKIYIRTQYKVSKY